MSLDSQIGLRRRGARHVLDARRFGRQVRGPQSAGPDHGVRRNDRAVGEHDVTGRHFLHRRVEMNLHAALFQHLGGVRLSLVGKGIQHCAAMSTMWMPTSSSGRLGYSSLRERWIMSPSAARHFGSRRTSTDEHEVQRAFCDQRLVAVGGLEHRQNSGAQQLGVVQRVERIAVLVGARRAEKVGQRSCSQHQDSRPDKSCRARGDGTRGSGRRRPLRPW